MPPINLSLALRALSPSSFTYDQLFGSPAFLLPYRPAMSLWFPNVLALPKNHNLSRTIGPPSAKLASQFLMSAGTSVIPKARNWSSRLFPCDHFPAVLKNVDPLKVLPPVLGMMLKEGPPRSVSPN